MSREAMQMALEALESDPISHAGLVSRKQAITALRQALETEPEALRLADALDDEFLQGRISNHNGRKAAVELRRLHEVNQTYHEKVIAKREWVGLTDEEIDALSQARSLTDELMDCVDRLGSEADTVDPRVWQHLLVYAPKPEEEPVAWMHNFITGNVITHIPADIGRHPERWTALYKDPTPCKTCESLAMAVMNDQTYHEKVIPKREWAELTDQEIHEIESKLKEKNT